MSTTFEQRAEDRLKAVWETHHVGEVGVLGPVVFIDEAGGSVKLGGEQPRAVLAYLALHARRVVAVLS